MSSPALKIFNDQPAESTSTEHIKTETRENERTESISTALPNELMQVNLYFLIADQKVPCDLYIFSQEMFVRTCRRGEKVVVSDLEKWRIEFYNIGFIRKEDHQAWADWRNKRHFHREELEIVDTNKICSLSNNTRNEEKSNLPQFLSYAFEKINYTTSKKQEAQALELAQVKLKSILDTPTLAWFFTTRPEEPHFQHCARVTYLTQLFVTFGLPDMPDQAREALLISAAIHELSGDPADFIGKIISCQTIAEIKEKKAAIPKRILEIIEQHDEYFNGAGGPKGLKANEISILARIFQFANLFDHYYVKYPGGTRRARIERTMGYLAKRKAEFDPKLWKPFAQFISKVEIY